MISSRGSLGIVAGALLAVTLAACSGSSSPSTRTTGPGPSSGSSSAPSSSSLSVPTSAGGPTSGSGASGPTSAKQTYVSIGDSYAAGYQPTGARQGGTTRNGFAYQVVTAAKAKGYDLTLVNFGCSGATTTSALTQKGCKASYLGPGGTSYDSSTQIAAAEAYLTAHRGEVGLVTVSLGGNDVTACADATDVTTCLQTSLAKVTTNLTTIAKGLRAAAGPAVRIVGLTYPDVFLGEALSKDPSKRQLATLSSLAFQSFINPALKSAYGSAGGQFADVTTATGAYTPMTQTTKLAPYGTIPVAVAKICELTFYCQYGDIHPRTTGYAIIAGLVVADLPRI